MTPMDNVIFLKIMYENNNNHINCMLNVRSYKLLVLQCIGVTDIKFVY